METKVVLVTGAKGAIGQHVATVLAERGWTVAGLGHGACKPPEQARRGITFWMEGDVNLANLRALDCRPSLIIHCAGSGAVGASLSAPHADFQRTVVTAADVLEFMRVDCPGAALVYPSSGAVYGVARSLPMTEDSPLLPTSPYGVHKKLAEELVAEHARLFGLKAAVVRLFSIYGEGFRKQLLWDACRRIMADELVFFGTGDESRDWLHVSDAAELLVAAAAHASSACPIVNGGSGSRVSVREVLTALFRYMGRQDAPGFCGTQRPGDPLHYQAEVGRALAWGWAPQIDLQAGLARYVDWFHKEQGSS